MGKVPKIVSDLLQGYRPLANKITSLHNNFLKLVQYLYSAVHRDVIIKIFQRKFKIVDGIWKISAT